MPYFFIPVIPMDSLCSFKVAAVQVDEICGSYRAQFEHYNYPRYATLRIVKR